MNIFVKLVCLVVIWVTLVLYAFFAYPFEDTTVIIIAVLAFYVIAQGDQK